MNTKQAIQRAFIKNYSQKDYDKITIKELCVQTPVARTTFYSYYQNMDDLKADIEKTILNGLRNITHHFKTKELSSIDLHEFLKYSMLYMKDNWDTVYAFLIIQPNIRFINSWKKDIKKHFRLHYPQKQHSNHYELLLEVVATSAIQCYCYWMQHPKEINDEKLSELVQSTITAMIHAL